MKRNSFCTGWNIILKNTITRFHRGTASQNTTLRKGFSTSKKPLFAKEKAGMNFKHTRNLDCLTDNLKISLLIDGIRIAAADGYICHEEVRALLEMCQSMRLSGDIVLYFVSKKVQSGRCQVDTAVWRWLRKYTETH